MADATPLSPARGQLEVRGEERLVLAWAEEDLADLRPPEDAAEDALYLARECEPALPSPRFAYRVGPDVETVDPGSVDLRLTARWLARRCPCQDEVRAEDFTVRSFELEDTVGTSVRAAALDSKDAIVVQLADGSMYRVDPDGVSRLPWSRAAEAIYVAPSRARWMLDGDGVVEVDGARVDVAPHGTLVGPPPWSTADATLVADQYGEIRAPGGNARYNCDASGSPRLTGWESPNDFTLFYSWEVCRIAGGRATTVHVGRVARAATTHPTLGTLFGDRDGHLRQVDESGGGSEVVHVRLHSQIGTRPIAGLVNWGPGVILTDVYGEVAFFSPETGEIPLQLILTIPSMVVRAQHGFFIVAQHVASQFRWEENETNVVVWYFERNDCSL